MGPKKLRQHRITLLLIGYDYSNIATIVKISTLFIWRNVFHVIVFLNKCLKELFDYGVGIQRRKEVFLKKKKKDVMPYLSYMKECQRSL